MNTYQLRGTDIGIDGTNVPVVEAIDAIFCLCPPSRNNPELTIFGCACDVDEFDGQLPGWLAPRIRTIEPSQEPCFLLNGMGLAVVIKQVDSICAAWISPDNRRLEFLSGFRKDRLTPLAVQPAIVPLLREILSRKKQILLHSAALRCPDGTGALISAHGYGGKTTTTMAMLRLGAKLLGDDLTIILPDDNQVRAAGIPEPFNLTAQTIAFFPECQGVAEFIVKQHRDSKRIFSPHDIYGPDCLAPDTVVHVAYFVRIDPEGPSIRRMNTAEAMQSFATAHIFARNQPIDAASSARLIDMISRIRVYELFTGSRPDQLGQWLMDNIASHAHG